MGHMYTPAILETAEFRLTITEGFIMPTVEDVKSQLIQQWSIQSNLLVMYRSICITALSVLTAAEFVLWPRGRWSNINLESWLLDFLLFEALAVGAFFITRLWRELQNTRGDDVNYLRARMYWAENAERNIIESHKVMEGLIQWRKNDNRSDHRNEIKTQMGDEMSNKRNDLYSQFKPDRSMKQMVCLQKGFSLAWVAIFILGLIRIYW